MVSSLDSGADGLGSSLGRGHCVVFFPVTVPLSAQVYKWAQANLTLGSHPAMEWHPIQGE